MVDGLVDGLDIQLRLARLLGRRGQLDIERLRILLFGIKYEFAHCFDYAYGSHSKSLNPFHRPYHKPSLTDTIHLPILSTYSDSVFC
jgi:hypothetical protein